MGTCLFYLINNNVDNIHHDQYHLNQNKKVSLADQYVILKGNLFYNPC